MAPPFASAQDAGDAYYDAIDDRDLGAMMEVWEASDEVLCLLPMMPAQRGRAAIETAWSALLNEDIALNIEIKHLSWIETDKVAIHLVEELVKADPETPPHPVYATNIYRQGDLGWHLIMHQNSPTPPPGLQV
jgi:ketosteroid isomerase-like protein